MEDDDDTASMFRFVCELYRGGGGGLANDPS